MILGHGDLIPRRLGPGARRWSTWRRERPLRHGRGEGGACHVLHLKREQSLRTERAHWVCRTGVLGGCSLGGFGNVGDQKAGGFDSGRGWGVGSGDREFSRETGTSRAEGAQEVVRTERQVRRGMDRLIEWELSEPLILRRAVTEGGGQRSR